MKPKWTFVRIWGRASHVGAANDLSITWGWIASSRDFIRTTHFGITLKINNIVYGFGIYRKIPWPTEVSSEISSSDHQSSDEVL